MWRPELLAKDGVASSDPRQPSPPSAAAAFPPGAEDFVPGLPRAGDPGWAVVRRHPPDRARRSRVAFLPATKWARQARLREMYGVSYGLYIEPRGIEPAMEDRRPRNPSAATEIPLAPERAFPVQLRPLTCPTGGLFVGRIEDIASGTVFRFGSAAEPTDFIARICDPRFQSAKTSRPAASRRTHSDGSRRNERIFVTMGVSIIDSTPRRKAEMNRTTIWTLVLSLALASAAVARRPTRRSARRRS